MKKLLTVAAGVLLLASCGNHENANKKGKAIVAEAPDAISQDSIVLTKLVRSVYTWQDREGQGNDFEPKEIEGDSLFRGIDWTAYDKRVKTLKESNYFDQRFLDNHKQIAQYIDTALKSGREEWPKGEYPSFGYDASPWCNCQDAASDSAWSTLTITNLKIENGQADFSWTWGDNFLYKTKATKENNVWKISYLEGFKLENFKSKP